MAIKVKLEKDGFIKDGFVGYSYTSALLDFLWNLYVRKISIRIF